MEEQLEMFPEIKKAKVIPLMPIERIYSIGRFTIAEVVAPHGTKGVGIARRSQGDELKKGVGERIAVNRAWEAICRKDKKKTIHHPLMG